ncbi:adenosylcobinamide-GDP ribazoletransferase [Paramagnetospirillum marisnigri]|uniref:Adenosylcobinamide-GDP ribazoletransferase n=1 Tax=Paramagnetospirillum marisnigri TaxID=1285242 RepID=A0A178MHN7_9PROT|nr:adenosylcobinamide-GDP ribazoletransferase [Paramagnetospirillum marisnigri]OAN48150.1 adenosylcobinamide-GDP ribazoletransferase [Paramagnetospirillum marisnigri]
MSESPVNISSPPPPPPGNWLAELHLAASFMTRLPLPDPGYVPGGLAPAMRTFPLVGAGVGLAAGLVGAASAALLPPLAAALLAVLAGVLITGALHEDGLADLADGLGARGDTQRRLEVMRDSRTGAYGVLALLFSVGLRAAALAALGGGWAMATALVASAALSRAMIPAAMQILPPARPDGLGAGAGSPDATVAATAAAIGLGLCILCLGLGGALAAALAAVLGSLAVVQVARRAIGGYTGDVLGAVQQVAELSILLAVAGMVRP